jgi:3-hydroxyisobutyrate dehydrogenase-like beta-hydroxyacid dehydrogenase
VTTTPPDQPGSGDAAKGGGGGGAAMRVGFVGFGALAQAFAAGLTDGGAQDVVAYLRPSGDGASAQARVKRLSAAGVRSCSSVGELVRSADLVVSAVPAAAAAEVAEAVVGHLAPGAIYVDPAPLAPSQKLALAGRIGEAGAEYVDVAVLGTVNVDRHAVPMMAAGPGAARWAAFAEPYGFRVSVLDGPPGQASLVKLLRSVYMKGRDALILEMLVAARRYGLEDTVVASIGGAAEQVPFAELTTRVMGSLALYAERRSDELAASAELVAEAGLDPLVAAAGAARLRWMADLGIREAFGGERPTDTEAVLDTINALDTTHPARGRTGGRDVP